MPNYLGGVLKSNFCTTFARLQPLPHIPPAAPVKSSSCSKGFFPFLENSIPRKLPPDYGSSLSLVLCHACQSALIFHQTIFLKCHFSEFSRRIRGALPKETPAAAEVQQKVSPGLGGPDPPAQVLMSPRIGPRL